MDILLFLFFHEHASIIRVKGFAVLEMEHLLLLAVHAFPFFKDIIAWCMAHRDAGVESGLHSLARDARGALLLLVHNRREGISYIHSTLLDPINLPLDHLSRIIILTHNSDPLPFLQSA